jgi:hypothetical protein
MLLTVKPAAALCAVLLLTVAGCGGGAAKQPKANTSVPPTSAPATGIVQGRLLAVGGPAPGDPRPMAGTVTFIGPDGSTAKAPVDKTGRFSIGLYPGLYRIRGSSPTFDRGAVCSTRPASTTLIAGKTVTANVYCQMR